MERLLARRQVRGRGVEYLVRWKGYGAHEDTWEPVQHLEHAPEKLHEFEQRG